MHQDIPVDKKGEEKHTIANKGEEDCYRPLGKKWKNLPLASFTAEKKKLRRKTVMKPQLRKSKTAYHYLAAGKKAASRTIPEKRRQFCGKKGKASCLKGKKLDFHSSARKRPFLGELANMDKKW